jgi:hypothetical protein
MTSAHVNFVNSLNRILTLILKLKKYIKYVLRLTQIYVNFIILLLFVSALKGCHQVNIYKILKGWCVEYKKVNFVEFHLQTLLAFECAICSKVCYLHILWNILKLLIILDFKVVNKEKF